MKSSQLYSGQGYSPLAYVQIPITSIGNPTKFGRNITKLIPKNVQMAGFPVTRFVHQRMRVCQSECYSLIP
jgi:hypothetical protein